MKKIIYLSIPAAVDSITSNPFCYRFSFKEEIVSIIKTVEYLERNFFEKRIRIYDKSSSETGLESIVNLKEVDGLNEAPYIKKMVKRINRGDNILHKNKWPNIKVIKTIQGEWVIFDGHRTMLAYMAAGKKTLKEVPYMFVYHDARDYLTDTEMMEFFGKHHRKFRKIEWRGHSLISEPGGYKILIPRVHKNMGEVFAELKNGSICQTPLTS